MTRVNTRARVAIGSAVLAVAGLGVGLAGPLAVSASAPPSEPTGSEPASSEPASSEPAGSAPELDADREQVVDAIITLSATEGIPFGRDCVSALVVQLPDADVPLVLADIQESSESADSSAAADTVTMETAIAGTMTVNTISMDTITMDTMTMDTTMGSEAEISEEGERVGDELLTCIAGDADPALVGAALEVVATDEETAEVDLACVESVLTALEDESLQAIIDEGSVSAIDDSMDEIGSMASEPGASDPVTGTEVSITAEDPNTFLLFLCIPEFMDMDSMSVETATADPASSDPATGDTAAGDSASDS